MAVIISGINLPFTLPEEEALEYAKRLVGNSLLGEPVLVKKSIDARRKETIQFVYSVAVEIENQEKFLENHQNNPKIQARKDESLTLKHGSSPLSTRPVVVGFGPAGMFAALLLAKEGYRPIVLERGQNVETRVEDVRNFWENGRLDKESNVQFGEGGAGTFSDGKLTTRIGDSYCGFVLSELVRHGAPPEIIHLAKPHVGTDHLRSIVKSIREEIILLGGEVRFAERMDGIVLSPDGSVRAIATQTGEVPAQVAILALGHSARDTFTMLHSVGVSIESKPFSVGVRIEHLQSHIDQMLYGAQAGNPLLPAGEYQLSHREKERAVYTFCMCPGGTVVAAASCDGMLTTNGMSSFARNEPNGNSAVVVSVDKRDFPAGALGGIRFQEELERAAFLAGSGNYAAPIQTVGHFLKGERGYSPQMIQPSYARGVTEGDFSKLFPAPVLALMKTGLGKFNQRMKGFSDSRVLLTGVETRTSSPIRILRDFSFQSRSHRGLYPCGEGAGYAGGIMSAAVDGLRTAEAMIATFSRA